MSTLRVERNRWLRILLIVVAVLLLAPLLLMVLMMPMIGMMWWAGGTLGTGMGLSPVWGIGMMLIILLMLLGVGYLLYRALTQGSLAADDPALEELRLTYVRGELSREEFEQRREDLRRTK